MIPNPDTMAMQFPGGQTFLWDSLTDLPGGPFSVRFRLLVDNGAGAFECDRTVFTVSN